VPGETDIAIDEVTIEGKDGADLTVSPGPLYERLGMRAPSLVLPMRYYSQFREVEDRRRITAYWQTYGFFDVKVDPPIVTIDDEAQTATIDWRLSEGDRYVIRDVQLRNAPPGWEEELGDMVPFAAGETEVDLETFRKVREDMADVLRRAGFGHAMVYSRAYVDQAQKKIDWYYFVDAGPETRIGKIEVDGAVKVPPELVKERVGLEPGDRYDLGTKLEREFDLLDTGAYASTFIRTTADTVFIVPGDAPDTGGVIKPEQIDAEGNFVPRKLPETIDLKIHVVEAPSQQFRLRAGLEFDPARVDTALGARLWLRNLFAPLHHLVLEGRIGYGWLWRGDTEDPTGLYGEALIRYLKPMLFTRLFDFRMTARFRDELYSGFHLQELTAGPGFRTTFARSAKPAQSEAAFFDLDVLFRFARQVGFGPFDDAVREEHSLADDDQYLGAELQAGVVWDTRDNGLEALRGWLLALRGSFSPGGVDGWNRYVTLAPDARGFLPIGHSFALGARASAGWAFADDGQGIPLGPRLFGGGAWGFRGFGRNELSPIAPSCLGNDAGALLVCQGVNVGGLSLFEGSLEARWLPHLKPYGAVLWGDVGGAGSDANPFENGPSVAAGLGLRLRFWYLPAAFDFGYRILRESEVQEPDDDPFLVFFRLGEAF
jgi:outer membrane translocation and assembly module TamA